MIPAMVALIGMLSSSQTTHAGTTTQKEYPRFMEGHRFIPFPDVVWPFVTTRLQSRTDLGGGQIEAIVGQQDAEFLIFRQAFLFEYAVTEWLAVDVELDGAFVAGTNTDGAFDLGANGGFGGRLGILFAFLQTERFYATIKLSGRGLKTEGIVPSRVLNAVSIQDGDISLSRPRINVSGSTGSFIASLSGAWSAFEWLGFQASSSFTYRRIDTDFDDENVYNIDGALGATLYFEPVALGAGFRVAGNISDDTDNPVVAAVEPVDDVWFNIDAGVYYVGRTDFEAGVALVSQVTGDDDRLSGQVQMTYYW